MATKVQLTGGAFQDAQGNLLANGKLELKLSSDEQVSGSGQLCSGITVTVTLNASGGVDTSTVQSVWSTSDMLPANAYYKVTGYNSKGQRAWGPNNQQVPTGATYDVGNWVPNQVISWTPPVQTPLIKVNGVNAVVQGTLNFVNSTHITWTDNGDGSITATYVP